MLVPRFVHGLTRDVKKESLRRIRLLKRGASWTEAMADDLEDVAALEGLILLYPGRTTVYEPFVHLYSPFFWSREAIFGLKASLPKSAHSPIFFDAIKSPWGVLGMFDDSTWVWPEAHHWPYVHAVERLWDDFLAVGDRYFGATHISWPLYRLMDSPAKSLFALGFPPDEYEALSPQGFHALYRRLLEVRAAQGLPPPPVEAP
jgi:hypothetical protein